MWVKGVRSNRTAAAVAAYFVAWFDSSAHASDLNGALASWVPSDVLVAVLALAIGALVKQVRDASKKTDEKIEALSATVTSLKEKVGILATVDQLGNMGDRLSARITHVERETAVILDRMERK